MNKFHSFHLVMPGMWAKAWFNRPKFPIHRRCSLAQLHTTPILRRIIQPAIHLRDYQEECIRSVLKYVKDGERRLGISLATGSGKTVVFTQLISRIPPVANGFADQTLIIAHRRELVQQAASHCRFAYPDKTIDIELDRSHASGTADITVASIRSIMSGSRLEKFDPERFKLILVDEAHHIVAPQYLKLLEYFGLRKKNLESSDLVPVLVGVSATFSRFDGVKLGSVIDHIVYHKDYMDMIQDGWLADVRFTTVKWKDVNLETVSLGSNGDFATGSLSAAVNKSANNDAIVSAWFDRCEGRKSTIVFCVDVAHVHSLQEIFRKYGIDARSVTGSSKVQQRAETVDAFKKGKFKVLLNCGVFTEGTDIPNIDCVVLARPTKSRNLLVQMIGRGMRLSDDKKDCHVVDFVSALRTGVVTTPTLLGLDPDTLIEEASVEDLQALASSKASKDQISEDVSPHSNGRDISLQYTDYDTVNDLVNDSKEARHIRALSRLAWVNIGKGVEYGDHCLGGGDSGGRLRILEKELDDESLVYQIIYNGGIPRTFSGKRYKPVRRAKTVAELTSFEEAVRAADTFAKSRFPLRTIDLYAAWRAGPASPEQVALLRKRYGSRTGEIENDNNLAARFKLKEDGLTKGEASDLILRSVYGGKGLLKRKMKEEKKREREDEKEEKRREMEVVRVGPLTV